MFSSSATHECTTAPATLVFAVKKSLDRDDETGDDIAVGLKPALLFNKEWDEKYFTVIISSKVHFGYPILSKEANFSHSSKVREKRRLFTLYRMPISVKTLKH